MGRALGASPLPDGDLFERDLNGLLSRNPSHARFRVLQFTLQSPGRRGLSSLAAQVRLDWSPGMRMRHFEAQGPTGPAAYAALLDIAISEFEGVVPGFSSQAGAAV
jgi:hypothetical protein